MRKPPIKMRQDLPILKRCNTYATVLFKILTREISSVVKNGARDLSSLWVPSNVGQVGFGHCRDEEVKSSCLLRPAESNVSILCERRSLSDDVGITTWTNNHSLRVNSVRQGRCRGFRAPVADPDRQQRWEMRSGLVARLAPLHRSPAQTGPSCGTRRRDERGMRFHRKRGGQTAKSAHRCDGRFPALTASGRKDGWSTHPSHARRSVPSEVPDRSGAWRETRCGRCRRSVPKRSPRPACLCS